MWSPVGSPEDCWKIGNDVLNSSALFPRFAEEGTCPPDTWAAGVAPSSDSLAPVVL